MREYPESLFSYIGRQRTTSETLSQAQKDLKNLLSGKEISEALSRYLVREWDNNLKYLSGLIVLTPDIAIWQCVETIVHPDCKETDHCVYMYCHGLKKTCSWRQPAARYRQGHPDESIEKVIDAEYDSLGDTITVRCRVIKRNPKVGPILFEETFQLKDMHTRT